MTTREVSKPPGSLGLYARAALPMLPGASRLPFAAGGGGGLPDLELVLRDVAVDPARLAAYNEVCGFAAASELPATYPFILAFPLHMALMTDGSFPFPAIGLVHLGNRITVHRPIRTDERLDFRVYATKLESHPKGKQFSLLTEGKVGGETVWECDSTIFRRGSGSGGEPRGEGAPRSAPLPTSAQWKVPEDIGRRYGAVSGDRNPIHLYPITAKLFGFPRPIAHGMWTKARCLAALSDQLPKAYTVDVQFKLPVLLPATVDFGSEADGDTIRFGLSDAKKGKPHLVGSIESR